MEVTCDSNVPHIEGFLTHSFGLLSPSEAKLNEITLTHVYIALRLLALCDVISGPLRVAVAPV
jgi:hypothetical protein